LLGYAIYWLLIITPGVVGITFFKINTSSAIEKFAISSGVGISIFVVASAIFHLVAKRIESHQLYIGVLVSALLLLGIIGGKKKFNIHLEKYDFVAFLLYVGHLAFLCLHFVGFPIFPNTSSADFAVHLERSLALIKGTTSIMDLRYPPAIELLLGSGIALAKGEPLVSMRYFMTLTATFNLPAIYLVSVDFFGSKRTALLCCLLYGFSSSFWYDSLYISGLYANILASLLFLVAMHFLYVNTQNPSRSSYLFSSVVGGALFLSHSTAAVYMVVAWAFTIVVAATYRHLLENYLKSIFFLSSPAFAFIFYPSLLSRIASVLWSPYVSIGFNDPLFTFLEPVSPFLAYMYCYAGIAVVILGLTSFLIFILNFFKRRNRWEIFFPFWFGMIWLLSLQGMNVWRFSILSLTPSIFLVGYVAEAIIQGIESITHRLKGISVSLMKINAYGVSTLFVLGILISAGFLTYTSSMTTSRLTVERQTAIYESMLWIRDNTPVDAKFLAFSEWEYTLLDLVAERESYVLSPYSEVNVESVLRIARQTGATYLIVSNYLGSPFKDNPAVSERWRNRMVTIYKL